MHRDLKLENVMISNSEIKLVDFGFATYFKTEESLSLGSPLYMAPELHLSQAYTEKVDVWSLGVIASILLIGDMPFGGAGIRTEDEIVKQIVNEGCDFTKSHWQKVNPDALEFVKRCLVIDIAQRASVAELLETKWIKNYTTSETSMDKGKMIQITDSLLSFRKASVLQAGVTSFLTNILISETQLKELADVFKRIDKSNDGFLSEGELKEGLQECMGSFRYENEDWADIIAAIDTNGDGQVDFSEFIAAALNRMLILSEENIRKTFDMFDKDGNGYITSDELKAVFASGHKTEDFGVLW